MFMRRMLEISLFCFYWFCLSLIALKYVYHKWLVQQLKVDALIGQWQSLFLFVFILFIIFVLFRFLLLIVYTKCKVSEKRLLTNMKKECRSLESGVDDNTEIQNSTESLLSEPTLGKRTKSTEIFVSSKLRPPNCGKSMENLSTTKKPLVIKNAKSLENMLESPSGVNNVAYFKTGNIHHGNSHENMAGNTKYQNEIYTDLTKSLRQAIMKRSKSLENALDADEVDTVSASVDDLLQIYENFYELQNSLKRNNKPKRKAPPVPPNRISTKNFSKNNAEIKTVNEKCQAKKLW